MAGEERKEAESEPRKGAVYQTKEGLEGIRGTGIIAYRSAFSKLGSWNPVLWEMLIEFS